MAADCSVRQATPESGSSNECEYRQNSEHESTAASQVSPKSQIVALLLCIFLGLFGAHRFYVGKAGTGLLYLFTGGLLGIGWIVDIFVIAAGCFTDLSRLPVRNAARR